MRKLLLLVCLLWAGVSQATTYTVCESGCDTTLISEAILGLCGNSDTVTVANGTYTDTTECEIYTLSNIVVQGESEAGVIYRWDVNTASMSTLSDFFFLSSPADSANVSKHELRNMTWRFITDADYQMRFYKYCDLVLYNMTILDSTGSSGPDNLISIECGDSYITDCNFSTIKAGDSMVKMNCDSTRADTCTVSGCTFTDLVYHIEDLGVANLPTALFDDCTFANSKINDEGVIGQLRVTNCDFTVIDSTASAHGILVADLADANRGDLYVSGCSFTGLSALGGGTYASYAVQRPTDDITGIDTLYGNATYYIDTPFYLSDADSADNGGTGGAGSYIAYNTLNHPYNYGISISYNNTLIEHNDIVDAGSVSCHGFMIGPNGRQAEGMDKGHNITVSNCTMTGGKHGIVDKGNHNVFSLNNISGPENGIYLKGCDTAYVAHNYVHGCTYGITVGTGADSGLSDFSTVATIKNNHIYDCGRGFREAFDRSLLDPLVLDHNAYVDCDTVWTNEAKTDGTLTTLQSFVPDTTTANVAAPIAVAAHSTDSADWIMTFGADSCWLVTPTHSSYSMGVTQITRYPRVGASDDFALLQDADSLILQTIAWTIGDTINYRLNGSDIDDINEHGDYRADSDSLTIKLELISGPWGNTGWGY